MQVVWGTQSRSGSQFVLGLTTRLLGSKLQPQSRISGVRKEGYQRRDPDFEPLFRQGRGIEYFTVHGIRALKLEDPCIDQFGTEVATAFPDAQWVTSIRSIDAVLISHYNIKRWGHDEDYVLNSYRHNLDLFERLASEERFLPVPVDRPDMFDPQVFADFFGVRPSHSLMTVADAWEPTNDLTYQKAKWSEEFDGTKENPPEFESLRDRNPWLADAERRYDALLSNTWMP